MLLSSLPGDAARLAALALAALVSIPAYAADLKQSPKIAPGLPADSNPSGAAAVGKLMSPQLADPSVPLPNPKLSDKIDAEHAKAADLWPWRAGRPKRQHFGRAGRGQDTFSSASNADSANTTYGTGDHAGTPIRVR